MATADKIATEALEKSGVLLLFAAGTLSDPQQRAAFKNIVTDIELARDAQTESIWTAAMAAKFWGAYNELCALIHPVNADTLTVSTQKKTNEKLTLPERTAKRYLVGLGSLLFLSVVLLALGSTISSSVTAVQKLISDGALAVDQTSTQIGLLRFAGVKDDEDYLSAKQPAVATEAPKLRTSLTKQYAVGDELYLKTGPAWSVVGLFSKAWPVCTEDTEGDPAKNYCYPRGVGGIATIINDAKANVDDYRLTAARAWERAVQAQSITNIVAATLLSIVLGMTGACAYVVRTIADQIRANSFSSTSSIRHQVRLWLGALAGVAIGFGGFVTTSTVSAAALAFLAGYAIEPVFATFDRIANSLK